MAMLAAIMKSVRTQPCRIGPCTSGFRFRQTASRNNQPQKVDKMEQHQHTNDPNANTGDSLGGGYATRSDEEGFGEVYGGNKDINNIKQDRIIHENHHVYDKSQGSEVAEKQKAQHKKTAS